MRKPVNEMGVVALFSQYSGILGYEIMEIQAPFPDTLLYRISTGEFVKAEFEFRARNFIKHGHCINGCDLIICWENDWPNCSLPILSLEDAIDPGEFAELSKKLGEQLNDLNQKIKTAKNLYDEKGRLKKIISGVAIETNNSMHEYRHSCGRLLFRGHLKPGSIIETKCPRCGVVLVGGDGYYGREWFDNKLYSSTAN